jgi:hypothetical protein
MIAIIIATLVCATVVLTAYWLRDLALRWLDEGRASEEVAKLREDVKHMDNVIDSFCASMASDAEKQSHRLDEIEALVRKAEASVREKNVGRALRGNERS